ncbi:response regulator transcription factor [Microlunatus sp. GCM10028923]|uniref:helix-turn-helix transcriptional regulator n=1 Tax=Microlunatus sp. GCM10028923 TaxID=3273400 RepID=UPI00360B57D8
MEIIAAERAARQAAADDDLDTLAELVEAEWIQLIRVPGLLTELLGRLDRTQFERRPALELIMDRTLAPYPRSPGPIPEPIQAVRTGLASAAYPDDEVRVSVEHAALRALRDLGQYDLARQHAAAIRSVGERLILRRDADHQTLGTLSLYNGVLNLLAGDLMEAGGDLHAVIYLPNAHPDDLAGAAGELALLHAVYGEHTTAQRWAEQADSVPDGWAADWLNPGPHVALLSAQLILATDRLDWVTYEEVLGRLHTGRFVHDEHLYLAQYAQARAGLVRGQQRLLLDQIDHLRRTWPRRLPAESLPQTLLGGIELQLALSVGDFSRAKPLVPTEPRNHHQILQAAHWLLATGRPREAAELISEGPWLEQAPRREAIELGLAQATALNQTGDHRRSAHLVRRALTQSGDPGTIRHSLVTMDRRTLISASDHEPSVKAVLAALQLVLFVEPTPDVDADRVTLTPREQIVLGLLADGGTAAEIAENLFVSVHTVRNQTQRIYRKLRATSRRHAIDIATRSGLLPTADRP